MVRPEQNSAGRMQDTVVNRSRAGELIVDPFPGSLVTLKGCSERPQ